jgi:hypothetical protein
MINRDEHAENCADKTAAQGKDQPPKGAECQKPQKVRPVKIRGGKAEQIEHTCQNAPEDKSQHGVMSGNPGRLSMAAMAKYSNTGSNEKPDLGKHCPVADRMGIGKAKLSPDQIQGNHHQTAYRTDAAAGQQHRPEVFEGIKRRLPERLLRRNQMQHVLTAATGVCHRIVAIALVTNLAPYSKGNRFDSQRLDFRHDVRPQQNKSGISGRRGIRVPR